MIGRLLSRAWPRTKRKSKPAIHDTVLLERLAYFHFGTFGQMVFPNGETFYTVEKPWEFNQRSKSCIPEGEYRLRKRVSPVVERTSGGEYTRGWEVTHVPNRAYIMIHPGNWPSDIEGCIALGEQLKPMQDPRGRSFLGVSNSRDSFREAMDLLDHSGVDDWQLYVYSRHAKLPN